MKIETGKKYKAKFKNLVSGKGEIITVDGFVSGICGMEVKINGIKEPLIASAFVNIFEAVEEKK